MTAAPCPCGQQSPYETCCGRYHRGGEPSTAEALMRSRYAAFVKRDAHYLFRTLHPQHEHRAQGERAFIAEMKKHFASRIVYRKLTVLDAQPADAEGVWRVLFVAHLAQRGADLSFAELSLFAHDGTGLRYLSGRTMSLAELGARSRIAEITG